MPADTAGISGASTLMSALRLDAKLLTGPTPTAAPSEVTPEAVLKMKAPAPGFMCPLDANIYGVEFTNFRIKDFDTNKIIFEVARDPDVAIPADLPPEMEHLIRSVKYEFSRDFLMMATIKTLLEFKVGDQPMEAFRMVERHFFKGKLVRSYDFTFGFVIPSSSNTWEAIYELPRLSDMELQEYVNHENAHESDSFYFCNNKLIMHNKAKYSYK